MHMKESLPTVDVFLPTYNAEDFLNITLESVLNQSYSNIKILIGDDSSTDNTSLIIKEYYSKHPDKIEFFINDINLGITKNCNKILRKSTSKYMIFLAGDDYLHMDAIKNKMDIMLEYKKTVLVGSGISHVDEKGKFLNYHHQKYKFTQNGNLNWIKYGMIWGATGILIKRKPLFYSENIALASDYKFFVDHIGRNGEIRFLDENLIYYRRHSNSITNNKAKKKVLLKDHLITRLMFFNYDYIKFYDSFFSVANFVLRPIYNRLFKKK